MAIGQRLEHRRLRMVVLCALSFCLGLVATWMSWSSVACSAALVPGVLAFVYRHNERGSGLFDPLVWLSVSVSVAFGIALCAFGLGRS